MVYCGAIYLIERVGVQPIRMAYRVKIKLPYSGSMGNDKMMIRQVIDIQCRQLIVDLIVFEMPNFYIILRMDFLGRNKAKTDCQCKKV